eukprot:Gregarina_sp_Pseudo_9__699@NODE_1445_length_1596_cov_194_823378_g1342_i0_p1_GENE_NODE_1445_length_1596_cov_194_823378_g1342_i0NODE_1445_length_1596_cov_194_823378_g1342_i0_p1_ORF_typecomplete_len249_score41_30TYW3/PF02676_14/4e32_NODE_1445_length_1596_cov_194_823378_g1342_i07851531
MEFDRRKRAVLAQLTFDNSEKQESVEATVVEDNSLKEDRSLKQAIDSKLQRVCSIINAHKDFYTTSCCSARISCYVTFPGEGVSTKKRGFIAYCRHEVSSEPVREDAGTILSNVTTRTPHYTSKSPSVNLYEVEGTTSTSAELKFEPLLLHVKCRSLENVRMLIQVCRAAGLKEIGLFGMSHSETQGFDFRISGSCRMSVPFQIEGEFVVSEISLKSMLDFAERLMGVNDTKILRLEEELQKTLETSV